MMVKLKLRLHEAQDGWAHAQSVSAVARRASNCIYTTSCNFVIFIEDNGNVHH